MTGVVISQVITK